jgi:putative hemolysin
MTVAERQTWRSGEPASPSARRRVETAFVSPPYASAARVSAPSFTTRWATTPSEVAAAQRLRFRVFAEEMGAKLSLPPDGPAGHDIDEFDEHCLHLLVFAQADSGCDDGGRSAEVVATCRVMMPDGARRAGRLYSDGEFDLSPLRELLPSMAEMGRVCVAPEWRNGLLILALWRELGQLMMRSGLQALFGCSSVGVAGGCDLAARLWQDLQATYLVEPAWRVRPWRPLALQIEQQGEAARVPPLLKGYLRCGGKLLGPPALDPNFNTADFPLMVRLRDLPVRYGKRVLAS